MKFVGLMSLMLIGLIIQVGSRFLEAYGLLNPYAFLVVFYVGVGLGMIYGYVGYKQDEGRADK